MLAKFKGGGRVRTGRRHQKYNAYLRQEDWMSEEGLLGRSEKQGDRASIAACPPLGHQAGRPLSREPY
jgi:hypothetical protein